MVRDAPQGAGPSRTGWLRSFVGAEGVLCSSSGVASGPLSAPQVPIARLVTFPQTSIVPDDDSISFLPPVSIPPKLLDK